MQLIARVASLSEHCDVENSLCSYSQNKQVVRFVQKERFGYDAENGTFASRVGGVRCVIRRARRR